MTHNSGGKGSSITVRVPGRSYPVLIEEGLLARAGEAIEEVAAGRKVFLLSDTTVWKLWGKALRRALARYRPPVILIPSGERHKRLATVEKITGRLAALGAERSSLLVAFGGGVVGDMGGFAASVYLRGIDYVQMPTTLLAQVDASIGGKTGVNLTAGKNLVGTFYQPRMVLADPAVLRTLPERQLRAGLFEAVKCAVIGDPKLFEYLQNERERILAREPEALVRVIRAAAALKSRVVSQDEKEGGLRRVLNFGHTLGHALEAATRYLRFQHGEAVAWGMLGATRLAVEESLLSPADADRITKLVVAYGPVPSLPTISAAALTAHLAVDKKVRDGKIHFVLPCRVGEVKVVSGISTSRALGALQEVGRENRFRRENRSRRRVRSVWR